MYVLCRFKNNGSENFELQFLKIRIRELGSLQFSADDLFIRKFIYLFFEYSNKNSLTIINQQSFKIKNPYKNC